MVLINKELEMKTMERNHNFSRRINFVKKGHKNFYMAGEKSKNYSYMPITKKGVEAFKNNDWNLIRTKSYWKEKDEASTEFEKRKVTLVYFALNKDKLDEDILDKIHNDYADYKYLKNISVSKNVRHTRFNE